MASIKKSVVSESDEQIALCRYLDRNNIFYSENPSDGFSSINIDVKGFTNRKNVGK